MKNNNYNEINKNNFKKPVVNNVNKELNNNQKTEQRSYGYYSKVLKQPFDSLEELKSAEATYYAELHAKEDKATQKKADALKVEEAFKALNTTRKSYKEALSKLTEKYSQDLVKLKETYEADRKEIQNILASAEEAYSAAIKAFTNKYPEGYHLTLKDGDFETTISGCSHTTDPFCTKHAFQMIDWLFNV